MYPYARKEEDGDDDGEMKRRADAAAEAIEGVSGKKYTVGPIAQTLCKLDLISKGTCGEISRSMFPLPQSDGKEKYRIKIGSILHQYPILVFQMHALELP